MKRRLLAPLMTGLTSCVGLALVVTGLFLLPDGAARPGPPDGAPGSGSRPTTGAALTRQALDVLREWDDRRRHAWSTVDVDGLRELYTPGSRTGRRDVRMLRSYAARGLRVTGLRMQVRGARLVRAAPGRAVVAVTERLTGAVARRGRWSASLPRDHFSTRVVRLRRVAGEWRVVEVSDQARAADTTAATSSSANS